MKHQQCWEFPPYLPHLCQLQTFGAYHLSPYTRTPGQAQHPIIPATWLQIPPFLWIPVAHHSAWPEYHLQREETSGHRNPWFLQGLRLTFTSTTLGETYRHYWIARETCGWIQAFLSNQVHCVVVDGASSQGCPVGSGVPPRNCFRTPTFSSL